jgi:hypothetical protein
VEVERAVHDLFVHIDVTAKDAGPLDVDVDAAVGVLTGEVGKLLDAEAHGVVGSDAGGVVRDAAEDEVPSLAVVSGRCGGFGGRGSGRCGWGRRRCGCRRAAAAGEQGNHHQQCKDNG